MSTAKNILRTIGLMAREQRHSSLTLSQRLPSCRSAAAKALKALHDAKLVRVVAWERSGTAMMPVYAWGVDAADVARPPALTRHEKWLKQREDPAFREKHKAANDRYRARRRLANGQMPSLLDMPAAPLLRMRNGTTSVRVHRMGDE